MMSDFDSFVTEHAGSLLQTAYLIVWDEREAEDLVQECLLKVARRWPRVRRMELPLAYSRRILINLATDSSRRRMRRRLELDPGAQLAAAEPSIDPLGAHGERAELLDALAQLPARQRAVLVLRYFNDLSERQTAETLGVSVGTVKTSASRGLTRLREVLLLLPIPAQPGEPMS
jgi:RNA polymerase sigma-70 factor (sigma-E family)